MKVVGDVPSSKAQIAKKHRDARKAQDKELYDRQIRVADAQIDKLVYELYGLTDEGIELIEKSL